MAEGGWVGGGGEEGESYQISMLHSPSISEQY